MSGHGYELLPTRLNEGPGAAPSDRAGLSGARRLWLALSSGAAAVLGLAPHVLHHAGPLAGAALLGGVGGSVLFGALGLAAAVPFLLRIRRRSGGWRVPAVLLAQTPPSGHEAHHQQ